MSTIRWSLIAILALIVAGLIWLLVPWAGAPPEITATGDAERGAYVLRMGGCIACHTDAKGGGEHLAGGRPLATPFGTFYTSNITPDPETGIGGWSTGDFVRALTEGVSPGGHPYYPAFPYPSYTRMSEQDLVDLKAHLDSVAPVRNAVPDHDLPLPFSFRPAMKIWQLLFLTPGPLEPDPGQSEAWNRGAYLVQGPGHCGECHTPRNLLGASDASRQLAGAATGPDGKGVPNITPHKGDGIGGWSKSDITFALQIGMLPDGDSVGGAMGEVVREATGELTPEDRDAIAEYLLSLPPLPDAPKE